MKKIKFVWRDRDCYVNNMYVGYVHPFLGKDFGKWKINTITKSVFLGGKYDDEESARNAVESALTDWYSGIEFLHDEIPKGNLCDTCSLDFITCPTKFIRYGDDVNPNATGDEADRVVICGTHEERKVQP
jgi:hypothetical protein